MLNIKFKDFIHDGSEVNRPDNDLDIYLQELGNKPPKLVQFKTLYPQLLAYIHTGKEHIECPLEMDFVTFKIGFSM